MRPSSRQTGPLTGNSSSTTASDQVSPMEIRTGHLSKNPYALARSEFRSAQTLAAQGADDSAACDTDAVSRTVANVLNQVVDLMESVTSGVESNRANRRAPVADQRLLAGASAVLADLVDHTRVGDERPLVGDARPRLVYGGAAPLASSRAWVAEVRQQVAGLREFLDRVSARGLSSSDTESLVEWKSRMAELAHAQVAGPLDLSA